MQYSELAHLELLAEVDSFVERLDRWAGDAPEWEVATPCGRLVKRLIERTQKLRIRLESPLIVATLGGTGTGKSTLINALVGEEVTTTGRQRPTTMQPTLITRPDLDPEQLGIDPATVSWISRDTEALSDLVLLDCPDPDTTEDMLAADTNLAHLRMLLPHCDVILVTTTQQKYRSARVAEELARAARGASLVFVQTHADTDTDIRDDWREILGESYEPGQLFFVNSLEAFTDTSTGRPPRGEFARLQELLTRELAGTASTRIRRANFLDLLDETLNSIEKRLGEGTAPIRQLREQIEAQRKKLAVKLGRQMHDELLANRRQWENRLLGRVISRWGFSPWSAVLRLYQGLGRLITGSLLLRVRTPAQMALWGALEGARTWRRRRRDRQADKGLNRAAGAWDENQLREASIVLEGYTREAGLSRDDLSADVLAAESERASESCAADVADQVDNILDRLAGQRIGRATRAVYETLFCAALGLLLFRLGKNYFWDSWLSGNDAEVYGMSFYLTSTFWLVLWSAGLVWMFTLRLRRGLASEIRQLTERWDSSEPARGLFAGLDSHGRDALSYYDRLLALRREVDRLKDRVANVPSSLGHAR
ncbi:MAG: 50S ribosome-binding GTPase [Planctomycetia bacterium]|jgi:hypothetical protein